jgi:ABC-type glycerol-3-phosphate transport system substrate-binding protein
MPWLRDALLAERDNMDRLYDRLTVISGQNVQRDSVLRTASVQLQRMIDKIEDTPRELSGMQNSIGSLGTWMMHIRTQPLAVDRIFVIPAGESPPRINSGFFARVWHEITSLFLSFFIDYSAIGNTTDADDASSITVWIGTTGVMPAGSTITNQATAGRDQANAVRALIDESFTPVTGVNVELMLVDMAMLLPATLSGQGPDVSLMVGADVPMNYGLRGAVADLTLFSDFDEIAARFHPESMVPYTFRDHTFGLPVTQTFPMLFYRRDVLGELELEPPETWDDVRDALSVLSENNMEFGLPVFEMHSTAGTFAMLLYQAGGRFYGDDGRYSDLDSANSLNVFRDFTRFFTDFGLPQAYDVANRFRTGEMPLAIVDYSLYNALQVFAPEIRGLWGFRKVPGTQGPDGTINHATAMGGFATVMLERSGNRDEAWDFMKWWTSADIQASFGKILESLLGPAARYPTANEEAFMQLPWATQDFYAMMEQYSYVFGIPQVPGGYFTNRQIFNAFYAVVTDGTASPREALRDNVRYINDEIAFKRWEFGID